MALTSFQEKQNNENLIKEWVFDQPAVNIGSHPDNDIVLEGAGIQPFHTVMLLHGDEFRLIPLSAEAVIHLDNIPFTDTVIPVNDDQEVEIGPYKLSVRQAENTSRLHVTVFRALPSSLSKPGLNAVPAGLDQPMQAWDAQSLASAPEISSSAPLSQPSGRPALAPDDRIQDALQVNLVSQYAEIDVEQSALFVFDVVNVGVIVDHFQVAVHGVPHAWVQISTPKVQLMSGQHATLQISLTPPRAPTSRAGKHRFEVLFTSPNYPGQQFTVEKELTIRPYYRFVVNNLQPQRQAVHWHRRFAAAALPITNLGNSDTDFSVTAMDEENGCRFDITAPNGAKLNRQAVINIPAGETYTLPLEVSPRKQPAVAFSNPRYPYSTTVQVADQNMPPQMLSGTATYYPLLGWVSILLLTLTLLAGLFFLLQPRIYTFQVTAGKDVIELGDTTRLEWAVSPFASAVNISNVDQPLSRGQTSLTVSPSQSTTYNLTSGNWLSNLFRLGYKLTQTVLVIPPSPQINVFEVDQTSVAKGKPINLRWSVVKADQVFLTIDEVVYELSKEEFSGERPVVLEKDALVILEARSASGSELRSYFINVVPPAITVQAFTIWVRPAVQAAVQSSPAKLAALTYAPDPNFPEKFVELVPDSASEIGYRVEFYQPERELQKGEQVIVEWNVIGSDNEKLTITPFEEELPSRGSQPFFPQESMNFVMTAKSGELERLFMLPVKVYDGEPPQPPKIEFFKASPVKMTGAGDVQFAWSVSGEWTRVQIASGDQVTADYLNPQGFKTVRVPKSATFILTAWNGSLSSAAPVEVTVDPALIPLTLQVKSVYPTSGRFLIGDKLAVTVAFTDVPVDKPDPTGKIIVTDGFSNCTITLPAVTCDLTFNTPGLKSITASYEGDKIYLQADSEPLSGTITVASSTVALNPVYYYLDVAGTGPGTLIGDLTTTQLKLNEGLFARLKVQAVNTVLKDDKKGKITLSVCDQELINGQPAAKISTCEFIGTATVAQSSIDNEFYADLVLVNFPAAGTRVLLFEYRHDDNAILPTSYTQTDVKVSEMEIYLSLPVCSDVDMFTGCGVGVSDPKKAKMSFDIKIAADKSLLASILPKPNVAAFQVLNTTANPDAVWTCIVTVKQSSHKLECTGDVSSQNTVNVKLAFTDNLDENYNYKKNSVMQFDVDILDSTTVELNIPSAVKVGQPVVLTGPSGAIVLRNSQGSPVQTTGKFILEEDNDPTTNAGILGKAAGACTQLANGNIEINTSTTPCTIFFNKIGSFTLKILYQGDDLFYAPSSSSTQVGVTLQENVTLNWQYQNGGVYQAWNLTQWAPNTDLPIRIVFPSSSSFSARSLEGKKLLVTVKDGGNPITTSIIGFPIINNSHEIPIYFASASSQTVADFVMNFNGTDKLLQIELALSANDLVNFAFMQTPSPVLSRQVFFTTRTSTYNFNLQVDMRPAAVGAPSVLQSGQLNTLYVDEIYNVSITVGVIWADSYTDPTTGQVITVAQAQDAYRNIPAVISLPQALADRIDWSRSTCQSAPNARDLRVPLSMVVLYQNSYISDIQMTNSSTPCQLVFQIGTPLSFTSQVSTFSYSALSPLYGTYQDAQSFTTVGLDKQSVTFAFTTLLDTSQTPPVYSGQAGATETILYTLTPTVANTTLRPLDTGGSFTDQFAVSLDPTSPITYTGTIISATQAQIAFTFPPNTHNETIAIAYNGNNWFNYANQQLKIDIRHRAQLGPLQMDDGTGAFNDFTPAVSQTITGTVNMRVQVSDGDTPPHSIIPSEAVEMRLVSGGVNLEGGGGAGSVYTIAAVTGSTVTYDATARLYRITLNASGQALFTITLHNTGTNTNVTLKYVYSGSTDFYPTPEQTTNPFIILR